MSYVYCGHCGQRGHNRLGCPDRKQAARENPDGYIARQIAREQEIRKRAVESRTCSYCSQPGHNRRGCPTLKSDKEHILVRQQNYIDNFMSACGDAGFGLGALVRIPQGPTSDPWRQEVLALVSKFNWDNIDFLYHDLDVKRDWNLDRRSPVTARVVSARGYTEDNYYNRPPAPNSEMSLTFSILRSLVPGVTSSENNLSPTDSSAPPELVGPASGFSSFPPSPPIFTPAVSSRFCLNPDSRAKNWEKSRLFSEDPLWSVIYPDSSDRPIK